MHSCQKKCDIWNSTKLVYQIEIKSPRLDTQSVRVLHWTFLPWSTPLTVDLQKAKSVAMQGAPGYPPSEPFGAM